MELKEAKNKLENEGYQRKLVYKLPYWKDGVWETIYFDDKDEAYTMIAKMHEINTTLLTYSYISVKKCSLEIFIEP